MNESDILQILYEECGFWGRFINIRKYKKIANKIIELDMPKGKWIVLTDMPPNSLIKQILKPDVIEAHAKKGITYRFMIELLYGYER